MEFTDFLKELLHIDSGFCISHIERETGSNPSIRIYLEYQLLYCEKNGERYDLYDRAPVRIWQHLSWFEYPCFVVCRLPRYVDSDGKT